MYTPMQHQKFSDTSCEYPQKTKQGPTSSDAILSSTSKTLSCRFWLVIAVEGNMDITVGERSFSLAAAGKNCVSQVLSPHNAALVSLKKNEEATIRSIDGRRVKRLLIEVSQQWLRKSYLQQHCESMCENWEHLGIMRWQLTESSLNLANSVVNATTRNNERGIYNEKFICSEIVTAAMKYSMMTNDKSFICIQKTSIPSEWLALRARLQGKSDAVNSVSELAHDMGMSSSAFQKQFKIYFKETLTECKQAVRLKRGLKLLISSDLSITAVAKEVGYGSCASFSTAFKRYFKVSPRQVQH